MLRYLLFVIYLIVPVAAHAKPSSSEHLDLIRSQQSNEAQSEQDTKENDAEDKNTASEDSEEDEEEDELQEVDDD